MPLKDKSNNLYLWVADVFYGKSIHDTTSGKKYRKL
jgi:hypothetical protein